MRLLLFFCILFGHVKRRVVGIKVFGVQMLLRNAQGIAETLIVYNLALAQIAKDVSYIGIVAKTNQIVIGGTRFLLC